MSGTVNLINKVIPKDKQRIEEKYIKHLQGNNFAIGITKKATKSLDII